MYWGLTTGLVQCWLSFASLTPSSLVACGQLLRHLKTLSLTADASSPPSSLIALMSEGLGFESQCVHFGHPSAGGCQRSTGDPRLILGKGYRHVDLGGYGRTDLLLNKPFYPNGLVVGILTLPVSAAEGPITGISKLTALTKIPLMGSIPLPLIGCPIAPSFVPNPISPPSLCPPPFSPRSLPYNIIRGSIAGVTKLPNLRFLYASAPMPCHAVLCRAVSCRVSRFPLLSSCLPHRSSPFVSHSSPFISHSSPFVSHSSPFVSHSSPFVSHSSPFVSLSPIPPHFPMPPWPEKNFYTGEVPPSFGGLLKGGLMRLTNKPLLLSSPFLSPLLPSSPLLSLPLPSSPFLIPPSGLSNKFYTGEVPPTFGGLSKLAYL
ncbi:unnamed protein product [Closterium sp. NIES-54]